MTSRYFTAFCLPLKTEKPLPARFGLTVPRAVGKAAQRNRIKRRMRAAIFHHIDLVPDSWSIVFNPRRTTLEASFSDLCREVCRVFAKCKPF